MIKKSNDAYQYKKSQSRTVFNKNFNNKTCSYHITRLK